MKIYSAAVSDHRRLTLGVLPSFFALLVTATFGWADEPPEAMSEAVATWSFDAEDATRLTPHGKIESDQAGPRPPEFPDFGLQNRALRFGGDGARMMVADPGGASVFDFDQGDAITIQAWVNLQEPIAHDQNWYVIGKGRTHDGRFPADNQNWALRLRGVEGQARVSFLFASVGAEATAKRDSHWHRWTSDFGFVAGTGWHRIAVSYRFGDPTSIRAWLNDKVVGGKWDMGGATDRAPVVDDDSVWIGSSMGGNVGNSFRGLLDEVSIFRESLSDSRMAEFYRREGPERTIDQVPEQVPRFAATPGAVTVRLFEGLATHDGWFAVDGRVGDVDGDVGGDVGGGGPVVAFDTREMLFSRLPRRYDDWGVRSSWDSTVWLQAATEIELPAGNHRLLLRSRGVSRVWLGDEVVARTGGRRGGTDGHQPVLPLADPPLPGHRRVGYGDQEAVVQWSVDSAGVYPIVLESLVGGSRYRPEPGETLVAIQREGSDAFELVRSRLATQSPVRVTDDEVESALVRIGRQLDGLDSRIRRAASAGEDDYWRQRHEAARRWLATRPAVEIPAVSDGRHRGPIDAFLAAKVDRAKAEASEVAHGDAVHFQTQVRPILATHCFRCHDNDAAGGLRMTTRQGVLAGGDSGDAAVVPGDAAASGLVARIRSQDEGERMPPSGGMTASEIDTLERWVADGVSWGRSLDVDAIAPGPPVDDAAFLRRVYLDCWGLPPSADEVSRFLADRDPDKRRRVIDRLLDDERVADHWVSYWQDVLAENPNILKPSLNNTGPFRFFIHEAIRDRWPLDRMVTELVMLRGSEREGGSAGFGMAADNDAPLATRGSVLASAFLGIDLRCARCHDSPYHRTTQQDLFALAAMLARRPITVPETSSVSPGFFEQQKGRQPLIRVTLRPGVPVEPRWPLAGATGAEDGDDIGALMRDPGDTRERLAALITSPSNERFAGVMVNRIWKRLMGAGLVEPADDWESGRASHPELLRWLSRGLVESGYDDRHVMRLILNSDAYQRRPTGSNLMATAEDRFFASPDRRRLTAEQVVDSLIYSSGHPMRVEELSFDTDGLRPAGTMITLGVPRRAWEFATLSNERDRPSLALPRAQAVTDVLEAFGWNGSRQNARTDRDDSPSVLQPAILSNGVMASWITRASVGGDLAQLAIATGTVEELVESLYLRFLGRRPVDQEAAEFVDVLRDGFDDRLLPSEEVVWPRPPEPLGHVSWTNHLRSEANVIKVEMERRARVGDPPDPRLRASWREAYEDVVWALINSPEWVWVP